MQKFLAKISILLAAIMQVEIIVCGVKFVTTPTRPTLIWAIVALACWLYSDFIAKKYVDDFHPELKEKM